MPELKTDLYIDSMSGGNGDIWMRLAGFYSASSLVPGVNIHLLIPSFLRNLARVAFGDRLHLSDQEGFPARNLKYTALGIRDLLPGIVKGNRYISPYQRAVIHDKRKREVKDKLNIRLFDLCDYFGWVSVPAWRWITLYQGYLEIIGIKMFRQLSYDDFERQLKADYHSIFARLNGSLPISPELSIPQDFNDHIVIFPTGTGRQFVPVSWAEKHLPDAYYAFFHKDEEAAAYRDRGLKTICFYKEPGDIIFLSQKARWTVSTDSFPSHLLQYSSRRCTITITEVLKSRIISPVFEGKVVNSEVACHPCLHLDRKNHPRCMAGFEECQNWHHPKYTANLLNSIPRS
ncbi:MAG TPA: hypothetical protein VKZ51_12970 [Cyclobacteriaceae bacterium]|nr:hypothetical protein [Cyclobacteriaceae bacterium]